MSSPPRSSDRKRRPRPGRNQMRPLVRSSGPPKGSLLRMRTRDWISGARSMRASIRSTASCGEDAAGWADARGAAGALAAAPAASAMATATAGGRARPHRKARVGKGGLQGLRVTVRRSPPRGPVASGRANARRADPARGSSTPPRSGARSGFSRRRPARDPRPPDEPRCQRTTTRSTLECAPPESAGRVHSGPKSDRPGRARARRPHVSDHRQALRVLGPADACPAASPFGPADRNRAHAAGRTVSRRIGREEPVARRSPRARLGEPRAAREEQRGGERHETRGPRCGLRPAGKAGTLRAVSEEPLEELVVWRPGKGHLPETAWFGIPTRRGGVSLGPYASLNLGLEVGDERESVLRNRAIAFGALGIPGPGPLRL